jgi:hypothetical protein
MACENALKEIVVLYRAVGKPEISSNNRFEASVIATQDIIQAITSCNQLDGCYGRFEELLINDSELRRDQGVAIGDNVFLSWALSTNGTPPIYKNFHSMFNSRKTLFKGKTIEEFFIASDDLLVLEGSENKKANCLKAICELINLLSEAAHYHDEKSQADTYRLVFVTNTNSNNGYHPVLLETKFTEVDLTEKQPDLTALREIISADKFKQSHAEEKICMFRLCLAEVIESTPSGKTVFSHVLENWSDLLQNYKKSFDVYLSGFSFSKLRNDLAKTEVDIAYSLSKVLSDITGKLFSIPISFVALLSMAKLDTVAENVVFVIGTMLVSLIVSGLVRNQLLLKNNIDSSTKLIFEQFEFKKDDYPEELKQCLENAKSTIDKQSRLLGITLHSARVVGWLVTLIAITVFNLKF